MNKKMNKKMKVYNFRIYPNFNQTILLANTFVCSRFIYNQMLAEHKEIYEQLKDNKETLKSYKYKTEKQYKQEFEWLKEVDSIALQQSRINLETAYTNFFQSQTGKRKGKKVGYPQFKKKHADKSYRTMNVSDTIRLDFQTKKIKLPKLKWIKYADDRQFEGTIRNATVKQTKSAKYYVSILVEELYEVTVHQVSSESCCIGLDYDSKNLFTDNQGNTSGYPRFYRLYEKKLARAQRKLSRKAKGSANRNKQRIKVARIHEKITNSRNDFQQKLSTQIIRDYDIIGVETLNMQGMAQCLNLGKSTLDNAWGSFVGMLEYKAEWYGKHLVFADKYYASSKTCNVCGYKKVDLTLDIREWQCPICGTEHHRDINAAINLLHNAQNTVGTTEINACGENVNPKPLYRVISSKQESNAFRH
jgi:putative transposase